MSDMNEIIKDMVFKVFKDFQEFKAFDTLA